MKSVTAMLHLLLLLTSTTAILGAPRGKRAAPCTQNTPTYTCRRPTADCPCLFQQAATERDSASYTLKIHLPKNIQVTQPWVGFFRGKPIEFDGPSFVWALLPEHTVYGKPLRHNDEPAGIFSLIITPQVTFMAEGNTIKWLQRIKGQPFRWFDITQASLSESQSLRSKESYAGQAHSREEPMWIIKELSKDEAPLQLPDHAITFLLDPKFIAGLSEPQQACTHRSIASCFIALPTINITTTDEDALNDACVQAALGAVELRTIHQKEPVQVRQSEKAIVCLAPQHI